MLDEVLHDARITVNADKRRAAHVLNYTYTMTLWRLTGANKSPLCIVKLARRNELTCLLNGRTDTPQVRNTRNEIQAVHDLRHADLGRSTDFRRAEVARG